MCNLFSYLNIVQNSHPGTRMCGLCSCCASRLKITISLLNVYEDRIRESLKYVQESTNFKGKLLPGKRRVKEKQICILKVHLQP